MMKTGEREAADSRVKERRPLPLWTEKVCDESLIQACSCVQQGEPPTGYLLIIRLIDANLNGG